MSHVARALVLALIAGLLVVAPVAAAAAPAGADTVAASFAAPTKSTKKVVIIVGATHSATSNYRSIADSAYAEAIKHSSNVVKVYSPNATWAAAKAAMQGASVIVYLGHGNGWPSPYTYDPNYTTKNGMGLNSSAGNGDNNTKYYGEPYFANEIDFAPNAVVLLNHLCYASGNSEPGHAAPTLSVAMQRVDNYGAGFIKAGARAVIAEGHGSINGMIRDLFTTHQTVLDVWRNQANYHGNEFSFQSTRSPAFRAFMDPDSPSGGYYRSIVGNPDLRTEDVTGVPYIPTDTPPDTLLVGGAASVPSGGVTLYGDPGLTSPGGTIGGGAPVRVEDLVTDPAASTTAGEPTAAYVRELDGWPAGWTAAASLAPQDSSSPQLWAVNGAKSISPNGDGVDDALALTVRFSEEVTWRIRVRSGWTTLWEATGVGNEPAISWEAKVNGVPIAQGTYTIDIEAEDEWGNDPLATDTTFVVDNTVMPVRLGGADRYATAAAISKATYAPGVPVAYVASGLGFADALAGAPAAGTAGGPLLLVQPTFIPAVIAAELTRLAPAAIVVLGGPSAVSDAVLAQLDGYTTGTVTRIGGADRYATAAAISAATYAPGVPVAYVASGFGFADALAGAPAAGTAGGPLLLVPGTVIPNVVVAELTRLAPARIVVLGGTGVVSAGVQSQLDAYTAGTVTRLGGADRYATAAAISAATYAPGVPVAYVASGLGFADALAGAPAAGTAGGPLLLVPGTAIPASIATELNRLNPAKIVVLGGSAVVSETVRLLLKGYTGS
ncbi:MAG TPA: cell wall-binding repeat-containing protein [Candidatus Limnocylindrales bacterium]|nr:cell wall-binding repeat-containing protein [Candidatus Limnocylindrales bacterium]